MPRPRRARATGSAVTPSTRRMRTSISTRSGRWAATAATTSSPSSHSATTSKPSSGPRMRATPARTTGWSSTMRTRITAPEPSPRPAASSGSRASTRQPSGVGPASSSPPSARARSRMPTSPKCPSSSVGRPPGPTVVGHDEPDLVGGRVEIDRELDPVAGRVAGHVGQRLAAMRCSAAPDRALEARRRRRDHRGHLQPGAAVLVDQLDEVGRAGQRRIGPPLAGPQRRRPWPGSGRGSTARPSRPGPAPGRPRRRRGAARAGRR